MNRRRALAVAATVVATSATATMAIAANIGLLGFDRANATSLGALAAKQPIELAAQEVAPATTASDPPQIVVQYEDVYVRTPRAAAAAAAAPAPPATDHMSPPATGATPVTTTSTTVADDPAATPTQVITGYPVGDVADD